MPMASLWSPCRPSVPSAAFSPYQRRAALQRLIKPLNAHLLEIFKFKISRIY